MNCMGSPIGDLRFGGGLQEVAVCARDHILGFAHDSRVLGKMVGEEGEGASLLLQLVSFPGVVGSERAVTLCVEEPVKQGTECSGLGERRGVDIMFTSSLLSSIMSTLLFFPAPPPISGFNRSSSRPRSISARKRPEKHEYKCHETPC